MVKNFLDWIVTSLLPGFFSFVYWEQKLLGEGEVVQAFDLNETVTDSNMSFLHDTPQAVPDSVFWVVLISVVMIGFLLVIFVKR